MYTPPVYFVVGLSDIGLFDLSVELSDLFVLSDYFVESSMQRFGQNNPISTVCIEQIVFHYLETFIVLKWIYIKVEIVRTECQYS